MFFAVDLMGNGHSTTVIITIFLLAQRSYTPERNDYSLLFGLQKIHTDNSIQKKTYIACQFVLVEIDLSYLLKQNLTLQLSYHSNCWFRIKFNYKLL